MVKPWVSTALYGARPRVAQLSSSERLEPAAMLVAAFEIEVGRPLQIGPAAAFEHEGVGRARIEPHVEDVGDPLVVVEVVIGAEQRLRALFVPGIDALFAHRGDDARVDRRIDEVFAAGPVDEQRDRHAPGALAAEHPVGPPFDHRADAVAALVGHEAGPTDRVQRHFAQARRAGMSLVVDHRVAALVLPALLARAQRRQVLKRAVHRHEPLRGAAEDDLGLRAPRMRVGVLVVGAGREQPPASRRSEQIGPSGALNLGLMT